MALKRLVLFSCLFLSAFLFVCLRPAHAANFVKDSFSDTNGTALVNHTGEVGATWAINTALPSSTVQIFNNRARSKINGFSIYYASGNPTSADYSVSADFIMHSDLGSAGVLGRSATTTLTYYLFDYEQGTGNIVKLYTVVNGSNVNVATSSFTPVPGNTYHFELSMIGNTITGYVNGVRLVQKTDSTITNAGKAGFFTNWGVTDTVGFDVDNFSADDTSGVISIGAGDLWENGYDNVGNPRQSTFSFLRLNTDATTLRIYSTSTEYGYNPSYASIGISINGAATTAYQASSTNQNVTTVYLQPGSKTIDIFNGPEERPTSTIYGTFLDSFELTGYTNYNVVASTTSGRLLVYGDSISSGFADTTNYGQQGYTSLLRSGGRKVMVEAFGWRALYDDASTTANLNSFVSRLAGYNPNAIWLAIGTNDYGLNRWSAASFGTQYAAFLDALHAALPSASIFCQTPIVRQSEGANSFGNTLSNYRSQIATACNARSWTTLVDGTTILSVPDLAGDGIHPSTAGHVKYENFVAPFVGGGVSISMQNTGGIGQTLTANLIRPLGSVFLGSDSMVVNWGDGNSSSITPAASSTSTSASHAYSVGGAYFVSVSNSQGWPNPSGLSLAIGTPQYAPGSPLIYAPPPQTINSCISCSAAATATISINKSPGPLASIAQSFSKNLRLGEITSDIKRLQQYLNAHGFQLAPNGPGSPGNETEKFGRLTFLALIKFQEAHSGQILAPNSLKNGTGYFGPSTREFVNQAGQQ